MLRVCAYQKRRSLRISTSFGSSPCSVWRVKSSLASWLRVLRVYFNFLKDLILDYYRKFSLRVSTGQLTSDWHQLEVGIITGCTISVTLFALAMDMLVKAAETECRGPLGKSGVRQPPMRAFMDDLTVTTTVVPGARWVLQG